MGLELSKRPDWKEHMQKYFYYNSIWRSQYKWRCHYARGLLTQWEHAPDPKSQQAEQRTHKGGRKSSRDACAGDTKPQRDRQAAGTHCCSTKRDDCFQRYFNELGVHLLLARWHEMSSHWKARPLAAQKMQIMRARRRKFKQLCPRLKASLEEGEDSHVSKQPSGQDCGQCLRLPYGHRDFPEHLRHSEHCSSDSTRTWGQSLELVCAVDSWIYQKTLVIL